jgi:prephenate dehydrogenase
MKAVGILGLGRFGSFWAKVLSHSYTVYGHSRDVPPEPNCAVVSLEALCKLPVIFLCVPMREVEAMLRRIAPLLAPGTLVVDTCSVKVAPVRWMTEILPESIDILATHPMFGPESAKEGLPGLPLMMHPVRMKAALYEEWHRFFGSLGLLVIEMTPDEHDRQAAMSQALTHMVGRTLSLIGIEETPIGTLWYRKLLAICRQVEKDSPELFYDMQTLNPYAAEMRGNFERAWREVCSGLTDGANHG